MANHSLFTLLGLLIAITPLAAQSTGCLTYQSNLYCSQCDQNQLYYQIGNGCVRFSGKACTSIDYLGNCINCQQGFYLAYGNTCTLATFIVGCNNYATDTSRTICLSCATGYILVANQCLQTVSNCAQYISGTNICAQCALGYTQSADWCSCVLGTIQNCVQYDCLGLCVQCAAAFPRLASNRGSCLLWINYCAVYLPTTNGCKVCAAGYILSTDALECFPSIPYCQTYNVPASAGRLTCSACMTYYSLHVSQTSCFGLILNCQTINYLAATCALCNPGFIPTDDSKLCLPVIANCYQYQPSNALSTALLCLNCITGFTPSLSYNFCVITCANGFSVCPKDNTCAVVPPCCDFYDGCGQCNTVKPGWLWCERKRCVKIPVDCPNNYDSCGNCVCTNPGQTWCPLKKLCVAVPSCCLSSDGCGNCLTLKAGFLWCVATQQCIAVPNCANYDSCGACLCLTPGFTLCANSNTCVQAPICCPTANNGCGGCTSILPNYTWCVSTNACALKNMSCPNNNDGCGNCVCPAGQNWCQTQLQCVSNPGCPAGSVYNNCGSCVCPGTQVYCAATNRCVVVLSCCANWDACGNCLNYNAGWALCTTTGACYGIPASCPASHNCATGACLCTGASAWCPAQNQCVNIPSCCNGHNNCGECSSLKPNSIFLAGVCYYAVVIPFCATYTANLQLCNLCQAGYKLNHNGSACYADILMCAAYRAQVPTDIALACLNCLAPYFLVNNVCTIPRCNQHVITATMITCAVCRSPTVVNAAKTVCGTDIQFCVSYNFNLPVGNNCAACSIPYSVDSSNLCSSADYMVMQYSASGNGSISGGLYTFAISISTQILSWALYNSSTASSYKFVFNISPIQGSNTFSIRLLLLSVIPGNSAETNNFFSLQSSSSNNMVTAELYESQGSTNVAILAQQWAFTQDATNANAVNIRSALNNQYLSYSLTLSATPVQFFLSKK